MLVISERDGDHATDAGTIDNCGQAEANALDSVLPFEER
jgi:hypothetical protein